MLQNRGLTVPVLAALKSVLWELPFWYKFSCKYGSAFKIPFSSGSEVFCSLGTKETLKQFSLEIVTGSFFYLLPSRHWMVCKLLRVTYRQQFHITILMRVAIGLLKLVNWLSEAKMEFLWGSGYIFYNPNYIANQENQKIHSLFM